MDGKKINELSADETVELLKMPLEKLRATPFNTRGGLIIHLAIIYISNDPCFSKDMEARKKAEEYLEYLLREGSEEDKRMVNTVYMK